MPVLHPLFQAADDAPLRLDPARRHDWRKVFVNEQWVHNAGEDGGGGKSSAIARRRRSSVLPFSATRRGSMALEDVPTSSDSDDSSSDSEAYGGYALSNRRAKAAEAAQKSRVERELTQVEKATENWAVSENTGIPGPMFVALVAVVSILMCCCTTLPSSTFLLAAVMPCASLVAAFLYSPSHCHSFVSRFGCQWRRRSHLG